MGVKDVVPFARVQQIAAPQAGVDFVITAPGQGLWRVLSLGFRFITSAAVANRTVTLVADDGTSVYFRTTASIQQAAGATVDYGAFEGAASGGIATVVGILPMVHDGLWLQPGWRLRSSTGAIDALDQYSNIVALIEEFPNGPTVEWAPTVDRAAYDGS